MKRLQSSNARRTRFSRSASLPGAASPRLKFHGWKTSVAVILGGTLLLVSVFYLQARLGGFGSVLSGSSSVEEDKDDFSVQAQRLKTMGRKAAVEESSGKKMELTDLEQENAEFESLDRAAEAKMEELEDEDMELDDAVIEDVDVLRQDQARREEEEEDLEGEEGDEVEDEQDQEVPVSFRGGVDSKGGDGGGDEKVPRNKTEKRLERLGQIKSLERHSPEESGKNENDTGRVLWDSVLGVIKMPVDAKPAVFGGRKLGLGKDSFQAETKDAGREKLSFSSDDEPLDTNQVVDFEDALFSRREKQASSKLLGASASQKQRVPPKNVFDARFAKRILRPPFDPTGSALLQDPDTLEPWGLTKSDRAMSRSFRKSAMEEAATSDAKENAEDKSVEVEGKVKAGNGRKELLETHEKRRKRAKGDTRRWGYFPGLDSMLSFSEFMERFHGENECELNVFQAWNSPPWSYTVRHQRGLESLLHFHPKACVVVFSETMEPGFFDKFAKKGLRVAVVRPNLEELLENTPAEMFASVWVEWRRVELFYIHYSELLRLAALYKYGGVYLDSDVVVLKPLTSLQNAVGMEALADGKTRLNGAVMAFKKASVFLKECMEEYTATYDDKLLDYNGADLLTRVASSAIPGQSNRTWQESEQELRVLPSSSFFPLSSSNIKSYFFGKRSSSESYGMEDDRKVKEEALLLLDGAYTLHLWNRETKSLVPESYSLVGFALEQHCIWCSDVI
ncbi:glycosyltransferase CAZy family GT32 [Selaginella moellendorffii]|uniref:Glycosyltransferase CAZy family GT32 n=1 Tax=Selaginella moellendorffii TaxID=88036 RepID=D8S3H7_SELML|nr:uncharacterized protein At4g19900 [Selaginella moellendorffii]EFJ21105.1 glycosyltransferase CAZy family GT32 [Selaginella moellendorffii]|eukprot:XP_002977767.1 uncharacterized protein At4g19900 [Selaginella moellendorffii]